MQGRLSRPARNQKIQKRLASALPSDEPGHECQASLVPLANPFYSGDFEAARLSGSANGCRRASIRAPASDKPQILSSSQRLRSCRRFHRRRRSCHRSRQRRQPCRRSRQHLRPCRRSRQRLRPCHRSRQRNRDCHGSRQLNREGVGWRGG